MAVLLVRHAIAESRHRWDGSDDQRPLTDAGHRQADALVALLGDIRPSRVLSSPAVRCQQTIAPLALAAGCPVETHPALAEGAGREAVELVRSLSDGTVVVCSHGDVIPQVLETLDREDGLILRAEPRWRKASTWVLERNGTGWVADYVSPPVEA